jgi:formyl-CoA transferase
MKKLEAADIAFARVNDWELLSKHAHLRRITVGAPSGPVSMPAPAPVRAGQERSYGPIPALGEHTEIIRNEFLS